jgi:hypothetical protein
MKNSVREIPKEILECKNLSSTDKLFYSFIREICLKEGFCCKLNKELSRLYGCCTKTIQRSLLKLKKNGFLNINIERTFNRTINIYDIDKYNSQLDKITIVYSPPKDRIESKNKTYIRKDLFEICDFTNTEFGIIVFILSYIQEKKIVKLNYIAKKIQEQNNFQNIYSNNIYILRMLSRLEEVGYCEWKIEKDMDSKANLV